jgi:hypothetical protein
MREPCFTAAGVVEVLAHRHAQAAARDLQVQRAVQAHARNGTGFGRVFQQHVQPGHADIGAAMFHVGGHIAGPHQHHAHIGPAGADDELAALFRVFQHFDAGGVQQRQRVFEDAALGQCERDHGLSCR